MGFGGISLGGVGKSAASLKIPGINTASILGGNNPLSKSMSDNLMGKVPKGAADILKGTGLDSCLPDLKMPSFGMPEFDFSLSKIDCGADGMGMLGDFTDMLGGVFGGASLGGIAGGLLDGTKGALIGGLAGAAIGGLTSSGMLDGLMGGATSVGTPSGILGGAIGGGILGGAVSALTGGDALTGALAGGLVGAIASTETAHDIAGSIGDTVSDAGDSISEWWSS